MKLVEGDLYKVHLYNHEQDLDQLDVKLVFTPGVEHEDGGITNWTLDGDPIDPIWITTYIEEF